MGRPITLFTGQWADLTFEDICKKVSKWGYDGVEIACWGDHMDVRKAATDKKYVEDKKKILKKLKFGVQESQSESGYMLKMVQRH